MNKPILQKTKHLLIFILLSVTFSCAVYTSKEQNRTEGQNLTLLSWNVNNLFDDVSDGTEYREFDPAKGKWTTGDFHRKMKDIARIIHTIVPGGPDIITFQEVENLRTLETLNRKYLEPLGYTHEILVPSPGSAVNTAILSKLPVTGIHTLSLDLPVDYPLRDILEINLTIDGQEVVIFNNHWKSKLGGAEKTEPIRREFARLLNKRLAWYTNRGNEINIIIAGDFNENPDENIQVGNTYPTALQLVDGQKSGEDDPGSLKVTFSRSMMDSESGEPPLFSPWEETAVKGSYSYRGEWERIDNIFLSSSLFDSRGLEFTSFTVFSEIDKRISDHLPILITFDLH